MAPAGTGVGVDVAEAGDVLVEAGPTVCGDPIMLVIEVLGGIALVGTKILDTSVNETL